MFVKTKLDAHNADTIVLHLALHLRVCQLFPVARQLGLEFLPNGLLDRKEG